MAELPVLAVGPDVQARRETVDVPEFGGAVVVRGLLASESFAIEAVRGQALRRVREEQREALEEHAARVAALKPGAPQPSFEPPEVELDFDELRAYGRYVSQLLHLSVQGGGGLSLYTVEQWEVVHQTYPGVVQRLQAVAERLSGMRAEDVRKNSEPSPS